MPASPELVFLDNLVVCLLSAEKCWRSEKPSGRRKKEGGESEEYHLPVKFVESARTNDTQVSSPAERISSSSSVLPGTSIITVLMVSLSLIFLKPDIGQEHDKLSLVLTCEMERADGPCPVCVGGGGRYQ
ncbi:hypothetical protein NQZ68_033464, partial [Dissostichus eleginoides]